MNFVCQTSVSVIYYTQQETEGFSVDCVDNYQETLQKLANKKYQIILLDVMIHGGNGFDMCFG